VYVVLKKRVSLFILALVLFASMAVADKHYIAGSRVDQDASSYLDIFNPNDAAADIDISLFFEKNSSETFRLKVEASSVERFDLSNHATGDFGGVLDSDQPVVVGSVNYDSTYSAGFGSLSASRPGFVWYFGEGYSSGMVKTFLHVLNPGTRSAEIGVTLYYDNGQKKTFNVHVPASSYKSIDLKEKTMPEKRFGMKVVSNVPVVASAATFNKHFSAGSGGMGSEELSKRWYFPEGYTSIDASEFLNLVNPSLGVAHVNISFYYEDGSVDSFDETVASNAKKMLLLNNHVSDGKRFSTVVESDVNILAEITHYDDTYSAGHGGVGVYETSDSAYFAYGLETSKLRSYLAVFNPASKEADLSLVFYYSDGTVAKLSRKAPGLMRTTVDLDLLAVSDKPFGLAVISSEPVVMKQVVYDSTHSAGHGYYGLKFIVPAEEETVDEDEPAPVEEEPAVEYELVKEDSVPVSKFKGPVTDGLVSVTKSSYDYDGSDLLVWRFSYDDDRSASSALNAVLSGGLFKLLEVSPSLISGFASHEFVSTKSEGYVWQNSSDVYLSVAPRGDKDLALGLSESLVPQSPASEKSSLGSILLIIIALVLLVIVIRWLFRHKPDEEDDDWEELIPSAKPRTRKPVPKEKPVKKAKKAAPKKEEKKPKKEDDKKEEKKQEPEEKEKQDDKKKDKEQKPDDNKEEKQDDKKKPAKKSRPAAKKQDTDSKEEKDSKHISIKEIPRDQLTAQHILDHLDEIPEYEDVFRHVNRDHEEIKPK
jgi:hypothetical protein